MTHRQLLHKYDCLSREAQRRVDELITALAAEAAPPRSPPPRPIAKEPFVGMWRDRPEFADGAEWVRSLRQAQWSRRLG